MPNESWPAPHSAVSRTAAVQCCMLCAGPARRSMGCFSDLIGLYSCGTHGVPLCMSFDRIHYSRTISNIDYSYSMCCGVVYVRFSTVLYSKSFLRTKMTPPQKPNHLYTPCTPVHGFVRGRFDGYGVIAYTVSLCGLCRIAHRRCSPLSPVASGHILVPHRQCDLGPASQRVQGPGTPGERGGHPASPARPRADSRAGSGRRPGGEVSLLLDVPSLARTHAPRASARDNGHVRLPRLRSRTARPTRVYVHVHGP